MSAGQDRDPADFLYALHAMSDGSVEARHVHFRRGPSGEVDVMSLSFADAGFGIPGGSGEPDADDAMNTP
jgi:hypothetical protein